MFNNKTVLITGGTGSFGKRFIRNLMANYTPKKVIVYSRDELKQHEMAKIFSEKKYPNIRYFLGDVRDYQRLFRAFNGVDIVIHAAALKHVPAAEYNPFEFIKTNVLGAQNIIEAAIERGVKKVVALSTDKASNPINLYGATKLCSDKLFVAGNSYSGEDGTKFNVVRYGNVIGSRGSVIPFFMHQKKTGRLTITDDRMTRFWISLDHGIDLVKQALAAPVGGGIYVPKIASMKIIDLAKTIAPDCELDIVGIRPGEKLHECMIGEDDAPYTFEHSSFYEIKPAIHGWYGDKNDFSGGRKVKDGFRYSSEINDQWISPSELSNMLKAYRLSGEELIRLDEGNDLVSNHLPEELK